MREQAEAERLERDRLTEIEIQKAEKLAQQEAGRAQKDAHLYARNLRKQILNDPIGSQLKLAELEKLYLEIQREPLLDAEAKLRLMKLKLEIELLRKSLPSNET